MARHLTNKLKESSDARCNNAVDVAIELKVENVWVDLYESIRINDEARRVYIGGLGYITYRQSQYMLD